MCIRDSIKTDAVGRNSTGYNDNVVGNMKQWWSTSTDLHAQRDIYLATKRNVSWNPATSAIGSAPIYWDNPYWTRYENYQNDTRNRFIGNFELNYELACLLYTSPSPRDRTRSRMPSSA
eukprot:TRINITY_DN3423_c0_g1_i1.p1 TRINITY_DN3423_c0_g1~~TRINITY_DN3423_c0_g1_i1.p1  ORF type:complete len:119 (-),score=10.07 TRINITY_DN3423_c0_g1_i1:66-422(-)